MQEFKLFCINAVRTYVNIRVYVQVALTPWCIYLPVQPSPDTGKASKKSLPRSYLPYFLVYLHRFFENTLAGFLKTLLFNNLYSCTSNQFKCGIDFLCVSSVSVTTNASPHCAWISNHPQTLYSRQHIYECRYFVFYVNAAYFARYFFFQQSIEETAYICIQLQSKSNCSCSYILM